MEKSSTYFLPQLVLFLLGLGLYITTYNFDYVLDDKIVFTENNYVKNGFQGINNILNEESFTGYFGVQKNLVQGARYRPLSLVTFAIEYHFFGMNKSVSHLINAFLYGILGVIIFYVLSFFSKLKEKWFLTLPFIVSAIYIVHPIHVEVVANVKGRDEILAMIGSLLGLFYFLKYLNSNKIGYLISSSVILFLGILGKESALTFLAILPLAAFYLKFSLKKIIKAMQPILFVGILYLFLRYQVIGYLMSSDGKEITNILNNPFYGLSLHEKFATIFYTLGLYIKLLFVPLNLTHDYYPYHIPIQQWSDFGAWFSALIYILMLGFGIYSLKTKNLMGFGMLFFLITLSITSNIPFTVGTFMNERFVFMASFGIIFSLVYLLKKYSPSPIVFSVIIGIIFIGYTFKSIARIPDWKNEFTLNKAAIKISKNSARANLMYGSALFKKVADLSNNEEKLNLLQESKIHIDKSVQIYPRYEDGWNMKAGVAAEIHKINQDNSLLYANFLEILKVNPNADFIKTYLDWFSKRTDTTPIGDMYYEAGIYWKNNLNNEKVAKTLFQQGIIYAPDHYELNLIK